MIYPTGLLQSALQHRTSRVLAVCLSFVLVIVSTLFIPSMARADQPLPPPVVLVFPFTDNSGSTPSGTLQTPSSRMTEYVRLKIDALGYYRSTEFSRLHPSVQRALNVDNTLGEAEIDAPTATPDRAEKIAQIVSAPFYLVGNIESITTDTTAQTSTVVVDGTFYETDTGAVIQKATVTGVSSPGADDILGSAFDNASGKLVAAAVGPIFKKHPTTSRISTANKNHSIGTILLVALGIALAVLIIDNHTHSSGPSSSNNSSGGGTTSGGGGSSGGGTTGGGGGPPAPPS